MNKSIMRVRRMTEPINKGEGMRPLGYLKDIHKKWKQQH